MYQALAVYFCTADVVLITQILYYKYVNSSRRGVQKSAQVGTEDRPDQPLLSRRPSLRSDIGLPGSRRRSSVSQRRHGADGAAKLADIPEDGHQAHPWLKNSLSVFAVCALGAIGWYVAFSVGLWRPTIEIPGNPTHDSLPAQILGYLSAVGSSLFFVPLTEVLS